MFKMESDVPAKGNPFKRILPARYILALLGCIGMAIIYGLKVNLSVAMVAMLNHTNIEASKLKTTTVSPIEITSQMPEFDMTTLILLNSTNLFDIDNEIKKNSPSVFPTNSTFFDDDDDKNISNEDGSCKKKKDKKDGTSKDGPFNWSEPLQGTILSCYFWGYFFSQIPGAKIAESVSAKWVMFFSVVVNIICTLLTPLMANQHYVAIIIMRILEGIGGGVTFPSMHIMLASWAPPSERSVLSAIVYAGTALGTVISMLMAGALADSLGWESVFYVMGGLSCIWVVLWVILIQDTPNKQPFIDIQERNMIVNSLSENGAGGHEIQKAPIPWGKIIRSRPFLAILISHTCSNWGWYMLLIELPFYMKQILQFNIKENAMATAIPFLTMWIFSMVLSNLLDLLRKRGKISTTIARKIATLFASVIPLICLLALCYIGCKKTLAVSLMGIGITSIGGMFCGFLSNHIDIAPNYAGTLMALTNTAATLPGIVVPIFVGWITHDNHSIEAWRIIFFVTIALYIVEILSYTILGSGDEQPWNKGNSYDFKSAMELDDGAEITPLNLQEKNKYSNDGSNG